MEPLSPSVSPSEGAGEMQLQEALDFLQAHLRDGAVGIGLDLATTERETSNPSALAVMERVGEKFMARLVLVWKTCSPEISEEIIAAVLNRLDGRGPGRQAERLCIDATNERYFAAQLRQRFDRALYVELVVGSEKAQVQGQNEAITTKALLGHEFLNAVDAGLVALPPERYLRDDFRLVKRCRGSFANEVSAQGMHGDTFDACKLAYRAVTEGKAGTNRVCGVKISDNRFT